MKNDLLCFRWPKSSSLSFNLHSDGGRCIWMVHWNGRIPRCEINHFIARFIFHLESMDHSDLGKDLYIAEELLGIPVNSSLCANYFVYFYLRFAKRLSDNAKKVLFSAHYRSIFRRQLRRVPILRDRFSSNNRTIKVSHTRSETIR